MILRFGSVFVGEFFADSIPWDENHLKPPQPPIFFGTYFLGHIFLVFETHLSSEFFHSIHSTILWN